MSSANRSGRPRNFHGEPLGHVPGDNGSLQAAPRVATTTPRIVSPRRYTLAFIDWCIQQSFWGAQDLKLLEALSCVEFADLTNTAPPSIDELARQLVELGIYKGRRVMRPYEPGFDNAMQRRKGRRPPLVTYLVMPRRFPLVLPAAKPGVTVEQDDLFEEPGR